jgi:hypothetical protein
MVMIIVAVYSYFDLFRVRRDMKAPYCYLPVMSLLQEHDILARIRLILNYNLTGNSVVAEENEIASIFKRSWRHYP